MHVERLKDQDEEDRMRKRLEDDPWHFECMDDFPSNHEMIRIRIYEKLRFFEKSEKNQDEASTKITLHAGTENVSSTENISLYDFAFDSAASGGVQFINLKTGKKLIFKNYLFFNTHWPAFWSEVEEAETGERRIKNVSDDYYEKFGEEVAERLDGEEQLTDPLVRTEVCSGKTLRETLSDEYERDLMKILVLSSTNRFHISAKISMLWVVFYFLLEKIQNLLFFRSLCNYTHGGANPLSKAHALLSRTGFSKKYLHCWYDSHIVSSIQAGAFHYGGYSQGSSHFPQILDRIQKNDNLKGCNTVIDIGANVGCYTAIFALEGYNVIAVEPTYKSRALLNSTMSINNLDKRVTLLPFAVTSLKGRENRELFFFEKPDVATQNMLMTATEAEYSPAAKQMGFNQHGRNGIRYRVGTVTLSRVIEEFRRGAYDKESGTDIKSSEKNNKKICMIKIDAEGNDFIVLKSGVSALKSLLSFP